MRCPAGCRLFNGCPTSAHLIVFPGWRAKRKFNSRRQTARRPFIIMASWSGGLNLDDK